MDSQITTFIEERKEKNNEKNGVECDANVKTNVTKQCPHVKDMASNCDFDKFEAKVCEQLLQMRRKDTTKDMIVLSVKCQVKASYSLLRQKLNHLKRNELLLKQRIQSIDSEFERSLDGIKSKNWCSVCHRLADKRYFCCFYGKYCSLDHKYEHYFHIIQCNRKQFKSEE